MPEAVEVKPKVSLEEALWKAQKAIKGIGKEGTNSYSKYKYTTAEQMIREVRSVLHSFDLTVRRTRYSYDSDTSKVLSTVVVAHHPSGSSEMSEFEFPAVEKKGTPLDKAVAAALTSSLNYFLRDLLLIPRSEEFDMDKRDDTKHQPKAPTFKDYPEKLKGLQNMVVTNNCLLEVLTEYSVSHLGEIEIESAVMLKNFIEGVAKKVTDGK